MNLSLPSLLVCGNPFIQLFYRIFQVIFKYMKFRIVGLNFLSIFFKLASPFFENLKVMTMAVEMSNPCNLSPYWSEKCLTYHQYHSWPPFWKNLKIFMPFRKRQVLMLLCPLYSGDLKIDNYIPLKCFSHPNLYVYEPYANGENLPIKNIKKF